MITFRIKETVLFTSFLLILSCHTDENDSVIPNPINFKLNWNEKTNYDQIIMSQLNAICGDSDTFYLNLNIDPDNALSFNSVHDFFIFKNEVEYLNSSEVINIQPGIYRSRFRVKQNEIASINILVDQKLDNDEINQNYYITNLSSKLKGYALGQHWNQHSFYEIIFNGTSIIDFYGTMSYTFYLGNNSVIYNDSRAFKLIIDIITGVPLSIVEIEGF